MLDVLLERHGGQARVPALTHIFGLFIDKFSEIVNKLAKEEGLDGPKLMHELIFILPYANGVLFS